MPFDLLDPRQATVPGRDRRGYPGPDPRVGGEDVRRGVGESESGGEVTGGVGVKRDGTSLVVIVINSAAGFAAHAGEATLDYRIAAAFTAAAVIGSLTAGRFATRVPAERLRGSFTYLVLAVAAFVVLQAIVNPPAS